MKGKNEIHFSHEQLEKALQCYLEDHFIKDRPFHVSKVILEGQSGCKIIVQGEAKKSEESTKE